MPLVRPHGGGELRPLLMHGAALVAEKRRAATLSRLVVSSRERGDIIMLGIGGFTPLDGFMTHADWEGVCDRMKMANGLFWPIPITLSADPSFAEAVKIGQDIALADPDDGDLLATMTVTEKYAIDKAHECAMVFRTADAEHPGVRMVLQQPEVNLAGPIKVLSTGGFDDTGGDPLATKLALAQEFNAIGDPDGARTLAQEVLAEAQGDLKHAAQKFLAEIS